MIIALADPPRRDEDYDAAYPNLGILYLISYGRKELADSNVEFHYIENDYSISEHVEAVAAIQPDIYGISYASFTSPLAHRTIKAVRARFPDLPIIAGGAHPTAAWESVLRDSSVDICVLGEGEETFCDIIKHFSEQSRQLNEIDGIAYRENKKPVRTDKRALMSDISSFFPAWNIVDFSKYKGMHLKKADPQTYVMVSRGCPYDCWFCANPIWKENKPWVRMREPQSIAKEVDLLYKRGIREVYLSADEFNINKTWPIEVAKAIQALGHSDMYFQCNVRADMVTEDLAREFKKMNIWMVHIGIESGNPRTIEGIQKKVTLDQILTACRLFQKEEIKIFGFMMIYHAWEDDGELAFETPDDVDNSYRFAKRLFKEKLINYMSWQVATPFPGSRLWKTALKFGLIKESGHFGDVREAAMCLPGISSRDVQRSLRKGYILKNWQALKAGNVGWKHITRARQNLAVILGQKWMK